MPGIIPNYRKFRTATAVLLLGCVLFLSARPVFAADPPPEKPAEPFTHFYVVYDHPEVKAFEIELRGQGPAYTANSASARIAVRSNSLIAYNLGFDEEQTSGDYLTELEFLPLYSANTLDIEIIEIKPGGHFTIKATKFGDSLLVNAKMAVVQVCMIAEHLVGATPPTNSWQFWRNIPEAFDTIPNMGGFVAEVGGDLMDLFKKGNDPQPLLEAIGKEVGESKGGSETIARGINEMTGRTDLVVQGSWVSKVFKALNLIEIGEDFARGLKTGLTVLMEPSPLTAKIMLAPQLMDPPERYHVYEINERYSAELIFANRTDEVWQPEQGYVLWTTIEGVPYNQLKLPEPIQPDKNARWVVPQRAPAAPGVFHTGYQMALNGVPIGPAVQAEIVVVPEKSGNLRDLLSGIIKEVQDKGVEQFNNWREDLERRLWEAILRDIERRLSEICGGTGALAIITVITSLFLRRRLLSGGGHA